jgi:dTDP-4-dehydrorhamnose reductase
MKIAITGAAGLFGHALVEIFAEGHTVFPLGRFEADITDGVRVRSCFEQLRPDAVIHSAAIRDLDISDANPAEAFRVNVHGTRNVVEAARSVGAAVAYISTDAVFDGQRESPYVETDVPNPPTVYGRTKLRGEQLTAQLPRYWIFRVSVLFGPGKINMIDKVLDAAAHGHEYVAPSDQVGNATYTIDAACTIREVIESGPCGIYHVANQGGVSRFDLARRAAEIAGLDTSKVIGKPSAEMGRRAPRPKQSVMLMRALEQAGFKRPRPWPEALEAYIQSR